MGGQHGDTENGNSQAGSLRHYGTGQPAPLERVPASLQGSKARATRMEARTGMGRAVLFLLGRVEAAGVLHLLQHLVLGEPEEDGEGTEADEAYDHTAESLAEGRGDLTC